MEQSELFKRAQDTIRAIEGNLFVCGNFLSACEQSAQTAVYEIEEYFAKILNLLAAHKATLLEAVQQQLQVQKKEGEETLAKLNASLGAFNQIMNAATMIYPINPSATVSMFQTITDTPTPNCIFESQITLTLSPSIFDTIQALGKVEVPDTFTVAERVSTLAGSTPGKVDGNGVKAQFNSPIAICYEPHNECLYVCDYNNSLIRKVTLKGDVSTVLLHNGWIKPIAIAVYHNEQSIIIGDEGTNSIYKIDDSGAVKLIAGCGQVGAHNRGNRDGAGNVVRFSSPQGIAVDQHTGIIYVSDSINCTIRKITPQGEVSTLAGSPGSGYADGTGSAAKFNYPWGLCFDEKTKSLIVCDYDNCKLRQVRLNGVVTTLCNIENPIGIAQATNNIFFVTQTRYSGTAEHKVSKVVCLGQLCKLMTVAGSCKAGNVNGKPEKSAFCLPHGIVVHGPSHACYVADYGSHAIRKISF